jgi:phage regulator Rha-like protein
LFGEATVTDRIESLIYIIREERVMLDQDLAALYEVETKALVQAVQRNIKRFPPDFMFQLSFQEFTALRSQIVTSKGRGGRRTAPYAFTEHGVAMLSSVLRSERAVEINIQVIRAFVKLRQLVASNAELTGRLKRLEQNYDAQFKVVFDAIRQLMSETTHVPPKRRIGF